MDIEHLREFCTVAQYRSISKAADHLHLSQPALSAHISTLEKRFGVQLFYRERPLRLTPAGQRFLERASEVVSDYARLEDEISRMAHTASTLAIGYVETHHAANMNGFAALGEFARTHPGIHIDWIPISEASVSAALAGHPLDCVMCNLCPLDSDRAQGIRHIPIPAAINDSLCLWADRAHPLASRDKLHWKDLNGIKLPHSEKSSLLWSAAAQQFLEAHGITFTGNLKGEDNIGFLQALTPDEVQFFDASYASFPALSLFPNRILLPIDEPDAHH
ncbi:MAG: LysR family transcriptional regulator, partial [Eggerthellaceae bacterium]|nr:LysR family transcriptional regulator [Eggerthellaceae bacterium]